LLFPRLAEISVGQGTGGDAVGSDDIQPARYRATDDRGVGIGQGAVRDSLTLNLR
jgi:hypothetical protein